MIPSMSAAVKVLPTPPPYFESDLCVKCNICTAACPVAGATALFPGPKTVGPQIGRFWRPGQDAVDPATTWCSGCGVCSRVCPHGVPVAEMNIVSKAELRPGPRLALRDWGLSRPCRGRPLDEADPAAGALRPSLPVAARVGAPPHRAGPACTAARGRRPAPEPRPGRSAPPRTAPACRAVEAAGGILPRMQHRRL